MIKLLLERVLRVSCFTFIGVLLILVLTACGPGSGGTGTGPTSYSSTASVTGGGSVGIPPGGAQPGSPPQCTTDCTQLDLRLDERSVELVSGCGRFAFAGAWEIDANGMAVLPGLLQSHTGGPAGTATLRMQFSGTPDFRPSVTVTVVGPAGQVLIGPRALGQVENFQPAQPVAACPP